MRKRTGLLLPAIACCLLFASQARATNYAYGYTSIYVDSGNVVRGYHRTELDYSSDGYYTPYVCGELSKDGVQVVRACQGGYHSATRYTSWPYYSGSSYSALSDHYVNMAYQEEDPTNPGYYSFADYFGYGFAGSGGHPIDWYWIASAISNLRPIQSITLGDTNVALPTITVGVITLSTTSINSTTTTTLSITLTASSGIQNTAGTSLEVAIVDADGTFNLGFTPATQTVNLGGGNSHIYTFSVAVTSPPTSTAHCSFSAVVNVPSGYLVVGAEKKSLPVTIN
jgi:hypothetical protein